MEKRGQGELEGMWKRERRRMVGRVELGRVGKKKGRTSVRQRQSSILPNLTELPPLPSKIIDIACGTSHALVLTEEG
jgi:hypothetical protein